MTAYMVFTREHTRDPEELATYGKKVSESSKDTPVDALAMYGAHEVLEGPAIEGAVILRFPTIEAAKEWYASASYTEARRHRFLGADYRVFIVEGVGPAG